MNVGDSYRRPDRRRARLQLRQLHPGGDPGARPASTAASPRRRRPTRARGQLAVATFNVENLAPRDGPAKFGRLAGLIVNNLRAPDIVAIEEVQDNNGATNNGVVDVDTSRSTRSSRRSTAAGGPHYEYR